VDSAELPLAARSRGVSMPTRMLISSIPIKALSYVMPRRPGDPPTIFLI
jgi:hypothetical protein